MDLTAELSRKRGLSDWRQHAYNIKQLRRQLRSIEKKKRALSRAQKNREKVAIEVKVPHQDLIGLSQTFIKKSGETIQKIEASCCIQLSELAAIKSIKYFQEHAHRQIDQICRRALKEEKIPHSQKVFSLFQPHTEWVMKGKAGVPVELGLRVGIVEDQHQFILHHRVMEKEVDSDVAVTMAEKAKEKFANLNSMSFDRGFYSEDNQKALSKVLNVVGLKRKGKLSKEEQAMELSDAFKKARDKHSAVESAINALEVHGLDYCPDHGIEGFKRYVALAIVSRNIHRIGDILHRRAQAKAARENKRSQNRLLFLTT
jgi:hypothetical protein